MTTGWRSRSNSSPASLQPGTSGTRRSGHPPRRAPGHLLSCRSRCPRGSARARVPDVALSMSGRQRQARRPKTIPTAPHAKKDCPSSLHRADRIRGDRQPRGCATDSSVAGGNSPWVHWLATRGAHPRSPRDRHRAAAGARCSEPLLGQVLSKPRRPVLRAGCPAYLEGRSEASSDLARQRSGCRTDDDGHRAVPRMSRLPPAAPPCGKEADAASCLAPGGRALRSGNRGGIMPCPAPARGAA